MSSLCSVSGCISKAFGNGLCHKHYMRLRRSGTTEDGPQAHRALAAGTCLVEDCDEQSEARGLCFKHYMRQRRHGSTDDPAPKPLVCSIEGCGKAVKSLGLCPKHYARQRRHGAVRDTGAEHAPLNLRIWRYVEKRGSDECWPWTGARDSRGYGRIGRDKGRGPVSAHRAMYEMMFGPIPIGEGYHGTVVGHICDNPWCVNPAHLWIGTQDDNNRDRDEKGRGFTPGSRTASERAQKAWMTRRLNPEAMESLREQGRLLGRVSGTAKSDAIKKGWQSRRADPEKMAEFKLKMSKTKLDNPEQAAEAARKAWETRKLDPEKLAESIEKRRASMIAKGKFREVEST